MAPSKAAQRVKASNSSSVQDPKVLQRISQYAQKKIGEMTAESPMFAGSEKRMALFPKYLKSEVIDGRVLGRGQFCVVKEVKNLKLVELANVSMHGRLPLRGLSMDSDSETPKIYDRKFMSKHCIRKCGNARYAIKFVSDESKKDPNAFLQAVLDISLEACILSCVDHPNIIKMRGMATEGPTNSSFFLVLDRLYDTLEKRVSKWKKTSENLIGVRGKLLDAKGHKKGKVADERLRVALGISEALRYLHSMNIVHRDLKPDNIGFDVRDDVKVFDFGLSKELRPEWKVENGLYKMTPNTGALRYMAPEVFKGQPYNERCDVYSFSMILWFMFSSDRPYFGYSKNMLSKRVFGDGHRPKINDKWPEVVKTLMASCWAHSLHERPSAETMSESLMEELSRHRNTKLSEIESLCERRRSENSGVALLEQ